MREYILIILTLVFTINSKTIVAQPLSSSYVNYDVVDSITYSNKHNDYIEIITLIKTDTILNQNKLNQARAVSVWICENMTYQIDLFNYDFQLDLNQILRIRKGSCNAYAFLFKTMCDSLGVECEKISGLTKQDGYVNIVYHAWNNIVIENNKQILIDVTWMNSNDMDGYYDNSWFNVDPEYFIYSHYPFKYTLDKMINVNNKDLINALRTNKNIICGSMEMMGCQNLEKPITMEYFLALPNYIKWTKNDYKPLKPFPIKKNWYLK
jgi:hypothetical protein